MAQEKKYTQFNTKYNNSQIGALYCEPNESSGTTEGLASVWP